MEMSKADLASKDYLNPGEAIELYVLSPRKFYKLLDSKATLKFVALYRTRKLILREQFEEYLEEHPELRRRVRDGR